jgi:hypothetical protein
VRVRKRDGSRGMGAARGLAGSGERGAGSGELGRVLQPRLRFELGAQRVGGERRMGAGAGACGADGSSGRGDTGLSTRTEQAAMVAGFAALTPALANFGMTSTTRACHGDLFGPGAELDATISHLTAARAAAAARTALASDAKAAASLDIPVLLPARARRLSPCFRPLSITFTHVQNRRRPTPRHARTRRRIRAPEAHPT